MTSVNRSHQSGHARAFIDHSPFASQNKLFLFHENRAVTFIEGGGLLLTPLPEGVQTVDSYSLFQWNDPLDDMVVDMVKAVAKAFEIYSDEPSQAYKQGYAEGQAAVLREWNESLK